MQDRTIDNALLQLRREGGTAKVHAEALLNLRGVELPPMPRKWPANAFRQRELKHLILAALRNGPQTGKEIAEYIAAQRPSVSPEQAYTRLYQALWRYQADGLVRREGRAWGLATLNRAL